MTLLKATANINGMELAISADADLPDALKFMRMHLALAVLGQHTPECPARSDPTFPCTCGVVEPEACGLFSGAMT